VSGRRPLGKAIPPDVRLIVFEQWIRDVKEAIGELEDAVYALDTGQDPETGDPITAERAIRMHQSAFHDLQLLKERSFRAPTADAKRSTST
jgi:hypothetical protein